MSNILNIEFIENTKRKKFQLSVISYFPLQVGGIDRENTYNLVVDKTFYLFLLYLENKYNKYLKVEDIEKAVLKETNRSFLENTNLPWIYTLIVNESLSLEFFPYECELEENQ